MKFMLYDTETTGLDYRTCGLHQLSGMILEYDQDKNEFNILKEFNYKARPLEGKIITQESLDIGHITIDDLKSYKPAKEVFTEFQTLLGKFIDKFNPEDKLIQIGYNVNFDKEILRTWFNDLGDKYFGSWFWGNVIDLMSDASRVLANVRPYMKNFKLESVAEMLDVDLGNCKFHDSMSDVHITLEIMKKCWKHPFPIPLDDFKWETIEKQLSEKNAVKYDASEKNQKEYRF